MRDNYQDNKELLSLIKNYNFKLGYIICKCKLVDCLYMTEEFIEDIKENNYSEYICGDYKVGRYAWILDDIEVLNNPISAKGSLGIWNYYSDECLLDMMKDIKYGYLSSDKKKYLLEYTEKALYIGLEQIKPGARIGDIGNAIETYANSHKLGVVRELVGHGVGSNIHEDPEVPNYGKKGTGPVLKEGMVIAVEPMLNLGTRQVFMLDDDWTIVTGDNKPSAHFEHTVVVTKDGYQILTGDDKYE